MNVRPTITRWLLRAARAALVFGRYTAPLFPEFPEFDDNRALWIDGTPGYTPALPLTHSLDADVVIVGGGFTGVSTAYHLSKRHPDKRIVLLEAKTLANGASGRNGGLMLNWLADMSGCDDAMTARVYQFTRSGVDLILDLIQRHQLPVQHRADGTLTVYTDARRAEHAHAEVEQHNALGIPTRFLMRAELEAQLNLRGAHGAVLDPHTGQLNGAQFVRALRPVLQAQGVGIYEDTPVVGISEGSTITVSTPRAQVRAKALVLATNGYTGKLGYFADALFPLHSHIYATAPLSPEQRERIGWRAFAGYHDDLDRIAYSCMTPDGRIVFGGGSNASYEYRFGNRTVFHGSARRAYRRIEATMRGYLPFDLPITHRWTGTLGITLNRQPLIGVRGEHRNVYYAIGYCGHGVVLANLAGRILADAYSGDDAHWRTFPFYQARYAPIPPEPFRWVGYKLFTTLTGRSPRA